MAGTVIAIAAVACGVTLLFTKFTFIEKGLLMLAYVSAVFAYIHCPF